MVPNFFKKFKYFVKQFGNLREIKKESKCTWEFHVLISAPQQPDHLYHPVFDILHKW